MSRSEAALKARRLAEKHAAGEALTGDDWAFLEGQLKSSADPDELGSLLYLCRALGDPSRVPLVEPHLQSKDPGIASDALWALCWLGEAARFKPYMREAVDPGFAWDPTRKVGRRALAGAGLHLRTHRDREFAQLLIRWTPPEDQDELLDRTPPPGMSKYDLRWLFFEAGKAMGVAVGADPGVLIEDDELSAACVKRFLAERQDG